MSGNRSLALDVNEGDDDRRRQFQQIGLVVADYFTSDDFENLIGCVLE